MPEFHYTAKDANGNDVRGVRSAKTPQELAEQLQGESLLPIDISETASTLSKPNKNIDLTVFFKKSVDKAALQMFCRQMHTLIKSGIPIAMAMARLAESTQDKLLSDVLMDVLETLNQGRSLHVALRKYPNVFSDFFINIIRLGENTGQLEEVFAHLASYLELELDTEKKVKAALRYPMIVIIIIFIAMFIVSAVVIPSFANMLASFNAELPLSTRILLSTSNFLTSYWEFIGLFLIVVVFAIRYYVKTDEGETRWSKMKLNLPVFGWMVHRIILARFTRLYALTLRAGLSATEGIRLVGSSTGNLYFAKQISHVSELVERGNTIANALAKTKLFPPLILQMVAIGEESGNIDKLLDDAADFYQSDIEYDLARISDYISPIITVLISFMVLILALGVYLPIWNLAGAAFQ